MRGNLILTTTEKPSLRTNEVSVAIPLFAIRKFLYETPRRFTPRGNNFVVSLKFMTDPKFSLTFFKIKILLYKHFLRKEVVMRKFFLICIIGFSLLPLMVMAEDSEESESPQYKDTPYFSGMPNYSICDSKDFEFDYYNFYNGKGCTRVEGKKFYRIYTLKENAKQASILQILQNYANAVKKMGGIVVFQGLCEGEGSECAQHSDYDMMIGKVLKDNSELWVEVIAYNEGDDYELTIVVKETMKQDITANDMLDSLNAKGYVALYINFDTGKSTIKPESKPIIDQIVQLLKSNPELNLSVEGHTDNVGNPESNKKLSLERAKSVINAIVSQGIDSKRLTAVGHGQEKPIADNNTEEGRARNRRVELIKK